MVNRFTIHMPIRCYTVIVRPELILKIHQASQSTIVADLPVIVSPHMTRFAYTEPAIVIATSIDVNLKQVVTIICHRCTSTQQHYQQTKQLFHSHSLLSVIQPITARLYVHRNHLHVPISYHKPLILSIICTIHFFSLLAFPLFLTATYNPYMSSILRIADHIYNSLHNSD